MFPAILSAFPAAATSGPWREVPAGFSGSRLWRSESGWRLKAWRDVSAEHLRLTHSWMKALSSFEFVPRVCPTRDGDTVVADGPWAWDLVNWMPGDPFVETPPRLENVAAMLATIHRAWSALATAVAASPAVTRRLRVLQRVVANPGDSLLQDRLAPFLAPTIALLEPWTRIPVRLQPCLCDIWTANILIAGDRVVGIIDFGAAKIDNPAVDLARLRGSLVNPIPFDVAYHHACPDSLADPALAEVLHRTGDVVALATWSERLSGRRPAPTEQGRIHQLLARLREPSPEARADG